MGHGVTTKIAFDEPEDPTVAGPMKARNLFEKTTAGEGGNQVARALPFTNPGAIAFSIFAQRRPREAPAPRESPPRERGSSLVRGGPPST